MKRTRSPSHQPRDLNSLLNLANHKADRIRQTNKLINTQSSAAESLGRSASVNYLYNKRQTDVRKHQQEFDRIKHKNHIGFTTEDIDDIYMPNQLDQFESKLKASLDISDNSEQEEIKCRNNRGLIQKQTEYQRRFNNNKKSTQPQYKRHKQDDVMPKFTITLGQNHSPAKPPYNSRSYMEEAKRKLDANRVSQAYYYNLNNKLKSSVANVIKATQDLGRSSELRQLKMLNRNSSLHELYDIRRGQIRADQPKSHPAYTCDDIDSVYMPWMMENYGRKLAVEALKRRGNMSNVNQMDPAISHVFHSRQRRNQLQKGNVG